MKRSKSLLWLMGLLVLTLGGCLTNIDPPLGDSDQPNGLGTIIELEIFGFESGFSEFPQWRPTMVGVGFLIKNNHPSQTLDQITFRLQNHAQLGDMTFPARQYLAEINPSDNRQFRPLAPGEELEVVIVLDSSIKSEAALANYFLDFEKQLDNDDFWRGDWNENEKVMQAWQERTALHASTADLVWR